MGDGKSVELELKFDANHTISYGYWLCPECKAEFYGGGPALHLRDCSKRDYDGCIYVIGPGVVSAAKEWAAKYGDDSTLPLCPLSLNDIREQLPHWL